jgi:membrane fusion protein (multidrug efflux system)
MPDSIKKVLLGALAGALLVGFVWHAMTERAKRAPDAAAVPAATRPGAGKGGPPAAGGAGGAPVGVIAVPARIERLALEIEALGTAKANESIDVTAKVSNLVAAVRFDEGQQVAKGEVLVELDGEQARADLAIAEAALKESTSQYRRSRELYTTKVLSDAQIEQIEATFRSNEARVASARSRLSDTVIRAPFAGRVGLRRVSVGSLVSPGAVITTLDDTSRIKLDFTIPETYVAAIGPGLEIKAQSPAYPGESFDGTVSSVDSRVDPNTRSVMVRAILPNEAGKLKPGMFLTVHLKRNESDVLLIPEEALVPEQGDVFVYVVTDGKAVKRRVQIGQRRVGDVQITDGLVAGEIVVTEGTQKLREGADVQVTPPPAAVNTAWPAGSASSP